MEQNNQTTSTPTPNTPPPAGGSTSSKPDINWMAIIAYVLFFVPLLTGDAKKDEFVMYHTKQGAVIFTIGIAIWVIGWFIPWYMSPLQMLLSLLSLANFVLFVVGIVNVVKKKKEPLPFVGKFADYFKF